MESMAILQSRASITLMELKATPANKEYKVFKDRKVIKANLVKKVSQVSKAPLGHKDKRDTPQ
jgi:hypothetical protein